MPLYQYIDKRNGRVVELCRSVEERDDVSRSLQRVTVPQRIAVLGSTIDPTSADGQVPKALKSLTNNQVNNMAEESGFTVQKFKEVWKL